MSHIYEKDPSEVLDYKFDWAPLTNSRPGGISDWLKPGETIISQEVTVDSGITLNSAILDDNTTSVIAWISGGVPGTRYRINCKITTSANRTGERSIYIIVLQR